MMISSLPARHGKPTIGISLVVLLSLLRLTPQLVQGQQHVNVIHHHHHQILPQIMPASVVSLRQPMHLLQGPNQPLLVMQGPAMLHHAPPAPMSQIHHLSHQWHTFSHQSSGAAQPEQAPAMQMRPTKGQSSSSGSNKRAAKKPPSVLGHSPFAFESVPRQQAPTPAGNKTTEVAVRQATNSKGKKLVCYYGTWAVYRPDAGRYSVENIDPNLCTHIVYGFAGLGYDNRIKPLDPWNDLEDNYGKGAMKRFTNLKRQNPDLKALLAIGGWNEGSIKYSRMAADAQSRAQFVSSVISFLKKYNFDGLDLDWEYPGSRGGSSSDKGNFVLLLKELKQAMQPHDLMLTAAVSAGLAFAQPAYDIPQVAKYLDLINLMAYDYHGGWESKTGHNAPLFHSAKYDLSREERQLNVNWSVNYWLQHGAPAEKIMLGVGSYGRSFTLDKEQDNAINAPASQKGRAGPYTREPGSLGYNEICESFQREASSWTVVRDPDYMAPYAYNGRLWVGYDDMESIGLKAQYAKSMGLGGMMMWSIETDDFQGRCHGFKYPLLNTIKRVMAGGQPPISDKPKPTPPGGSTTTTSRPPPAVSSTSTTSTTTSTTKKPELEIEDEANSPKPTLTSSTTRKPKPKPSSSTTKKPKVTTKRPMVTTSTKPSTTTSVMTSTTTSTSTTIMPPVVNPNPSADFECQADGMFADPRNCRKFIRCVSQSGGYAMYRFDCPPGTAWNEQPQYCDHLYNVPSCTGNQLRRLPVAVTSQVLNPSMSFWNHNLIHF